MEHVGRLGAVLVGGIAADTTSCALRAGAVDLW